MNHLLNREWQRKGASLSDWRACLEYGLSEDELLEAVRLDRLQYRVCPPDKKPSLRLLRREVERLVESHYGQRYLEEKRRAVELANIESELRKLKTRFETLEKRRSRILEDRT